MKAKTVVKLIAGLAVAALGAFGSANAALQIVSGVDPTQLTAEAIGDPGGTSFLNPATPGASAGVGMPSVLGGWPDTASFQPDPSFGNARGISGYDGSYLNLTQATYVTFQFTGRGDAIDHDVFQINTGSGFMTIWDNQSATNGTCGANADGSLNCPFALSQQTFFFNPGLIAFQFVNLDTPATVANDGVSNIHDNPNGAAFFLGADPYLTSTPYDCLGPNAGCRAVYAGFTDRQAGGPGADHDYEDLIVRISVPEPGTMLLLGGGILGLAAIRRRKTDA